MIKLIAVSIIFASIIIYLKSVNSELSLLATIGSGIILIYLSVEYLSDTFDFLSKLVSLGGLNSDLYRIIFKIT